MAHIKKLLFILNSDLSDQDALASIRALTLDKNDEVRLRALEKLANFDALENTNVILGCLSDSDELVRAEAVQAIGQFELRTLEPHVNKMLLDHDEIVRATAAWSLSRVGNEGTITILKESLENDSSCVVKKGIIYSLAVLDLTNQSFWIDTLLGYLRSENYLIRCGVANLLSENRIPAYKRKILRKLRTSYQLEVTVAAKSSLKNAIEELSGRKIMG